jgi:hypothetical protein
VETRPAIHLLLPQRLYQLEESRKRALLIHHLQRHFILPTVEEKKRRDQMKGIRVVFLWENISAFLGSVSGPKSYLQETIDNLPPDIIRVGGEDARSKKLIRAA